jgi:glycosyltransferase involved in cell wall biosynthesis
MRILLAAPHRYPAFDQQGSGLEPKAYPSGSGYHLHDLLAKGLAEDGHDVFYYLSQGQSARLPDGVIPTETLRSDVDLFHTPVGPPGFAESVAAATGLDRKPALYTCHLKETGRIAAPNWVFVSRILAQAYGAERFVLNGIDPADVTFSATKRDYFLFLGSMHRAIDKGLPHALALSQSLGFRLVVAGTGLDRQTVEYVAGLCAAAGADYVGDVRGEKKAELLAAAKAVLFPSRLHEGCPLVIIEALMSGTPVVSSRCKGAVEILTPETGFLCDNHAEWSAAIARVHEISPAHCRAHALEHFHYRRMVRDYEREYLREIEGCSA